MAAPGKRCTWDAGVWSLPPAHVLGFGKPQELQDLGPSREDSVASLPLLGAGEAHKVVDVTESCERGAQRGPAELPREEMEPLAGGTRPDVR